MFDLNEFDPVHYSNEREFEANQKKAALYLIDRVGDAWLVHEWAKAPTFLRVLCNRNGGDEDWLVASRHYEMPTWVEFMDAGREPHVYVLGCFYIFVGKHA